MKHYYVGAHNHFPARKRQPSDQRWPRSNTYVFILNRA